MRARARYVDLMSSLPHLGRLFTAKERPITRIQLDRRLRRLEPADARALAAIEGILRWHVTAAGLGDVEQTAQAEAVLAELEDPTLLEVTRRRLELRTLVAALRRRRDGQAPPADPRELGYHRRDRRILAHWEEVAFGLQHTAPWIEAADALVRDGDALALEKQLLARGWADLDALGQGHYFDFPAVVIYVLRWDLMDRWMRYDGAAAAARFDALVQAALAGRTPLFAREAGQHG